MTAREIAPGVRWVGALHGDRRLFDDLIPLPDGTTYNAYLITGKEKTALVDTVDPMKTEVLLTHLAGVPRVDYVVIQHVEQDHSGSLPVVLNRYPHARVLATPKAKGMIVDHLGVPEDRITPVEDGETVSLGGRTLEFLHAPWVHWPETMLTYLREERVLFPCDLFGSHLALPGLFYTDRPRVYEAAKRYYAEIMMPFRAAIQGHLERLARYTFSLIAPSHGPIHQEPSFILDAYRDWVLSPPKDEVVLAYVSMHGSTARMAERLVAALAERGVGVEPFNLTVTDLGRLAMALVDARTLVIGAPTVLVGPHPSAVSAMYLAAALRPKLRHAAFIGSYGWSSQAEARMKALLDPLKPDWLPSVLCRGLPTDETRAALDRLADAIVARHKEP